MSKTSSKLLRKKNSKLAVGNYRPISLLSNINKVFEKLLHTRLVNFLDNNNIIYNNQFGFRKKHGTNHAMIALTELIRSSLDKNEFTAGIFIDLQKAFDTVGWTQDTKKTPTLWHQRESLRSHLFLSQ